MRSIEFSQRTIEAIGTMTEAVKAAQTAKQANQPYNSKDGLLDKAKQACKAVNNSIIADALDELKSMDKEAAFMSFMADWAVPAYAVKDDAKAGVIATTVDGKENALASRISFSDFDKAVGFVSKDGGNYKFLVQILVDNALNNWASADGSASIQALPTAVINYRTSLSAPWITDKGKPMTKKSDIAAQFNALLAIVSPASFAGSVKMRGADVRDLITAALKYQRGKENGTSVFKLGNYAELEDLVFDRIYAAWKNIATKIEDSYERNADPAAPGMGDKPAAGGPVTSKAVDKETAKV